MALVPLALVGGVLAAFEARRLADVVDEKFSGRRWDFPSRIYGDEFLVHLGLDVAASGLRRRLERLSYREVEHAPAVGGEVRWGASAAEIALRPGAQGRDRTQRVRIALDAGRVAGIADLDTGEALPLFALEPEEITGIYAGEWQERRAVRVVDVAPALVRAILVTEDSRFFRHNGVDLIGVGRAALANLRSGSVRQGGSTLTQQLMKNFFLSNDRTLARKLREVAMALVAERRYSKMQILENYLNEIYLGQRGARGIFGVAEAARFYFGKDPRDLRLHEVALLAGLIRAPNAYSPFQSPERALERRNTVLRLLLEAGEIDGAGYREAKQSPLGVLPAIGEPSEASYFVDLVKAELAGRFPAPLLASEGLEIFTSLDPLLQEQASRAVAEGLGRIEHDHPRLRREQVAERVQAALVALRPYSGEIRALVGGRSYQTSQFGRATHARRQPGSAFKPIVYLAALLATGPAHVTPTTLVDDSPFAWLYDDERTWMPENDGGHYFGPVTVRTALERSLNAATARVAQGVGLPAIVALARNLGWSTPLPELPSVILGSAETTPLELASIYAVIAAGGTRAEPHAVRRVESRDGQLVSGEMPSLRPVLPAAEAYVLTHLLEGVLDRGTARAARAAGFTRPAAGKTGTSNDYRDAWFVGFTPDLVTAVWVGFDQRAELGLTGARAALPIWTDFMGGATAADPPRDFPTPPGVTLVLIDRESGRPVDEWLPATDAGEDEFREAFLDTDRPDAERDAQVPGQPADEALEPAQDPAEHAPVADDPRVGDE